MTRIERDVRSPARRTEPASVAMLHRRQRRLTMAVIVLAVGWAASVIHDLIAHVRPVSASEGRPATLAANDSVLYVRGLVLLDQNGTERLRLGAPLPEPIMMGRRFSRGSPVSGIIIYDHEGNERGGYVTGDVGRTASLSLDEINRAAIHIGVSDRGEAHVQLGNGLGSYAYLGVIPSTGFLRLDRAGQVVTILPDTALGVTR